MTVSVESVINPIAPAMSPSKACQYQSRNHDVRSRLDVTHLFSVSLRVSVSSQNAHHWSKTLCA